MTSEQKLQVAKKVLGEMSRWGITSARHYNKLEAEGQFRPDYGLLMNALNTSQTYKELPLVLKQHEIIQIEQTVLDLLKG